eukprot:scaffold306_cov241-Pinguiococcus_pyrenoidosus.AAC.12
MDHPTPVDPEGQPPTAPRDDEQGEEVGPFLADGLEEKASSADEPSEELPEEKETGQQDEEHEEKAVEDEETPFLAVPAEETKASGREGAVASEEGGADAEDHPADIPEPDDGVSDGVMPRGSSTVSQATNPL